MRDVSKALLLAVLLLSGCRSANSRKHAYVESGKRYEREGKPREAAIQFSNAVRIDPAFVEGHYELSQAYRQIGSIRLAIYELGRVLQLSPDNMQARLDVGQLLLQMGQVDAASAQARWVAFKQPGNAAAQALVSATAAVAGNRAEALRAIRAALALEPNRSEYHASFGVLLAGDAKTQTDALTELQTAIRLDGKSLSARVALADLLERSGDFHAAEEQRRLAVSLAPQSVDARTGLAALYLRFGDKPRAEETLRKATDDLADDAAAAPLLTGFYQQTGQMDRAQATYEDLVHRHPNSLALQLAYIRVLMDRGAYDKARPLIQDLAQKHETDPGVDLLQAYVLMHDGQNTEAVDVLQTAAKNDPDNLDIAILLGKAQLQAGDLRQATETFHNALQLNPQSLDALRGMADVAYRKGDLSGLREAARLILAQYPQLADGYLWRGVANLREHQNAPAMSDLEEALRRDPNNGLTLVQLGLTKVATGDSVKARLLFEQALRNAPDAAALAALTQMDVQNGQASAAIARIQQQIQRAPASPELYDQLAQAQLAAKDPGSAAGSVKHALDLDHSNRSAMQTFTQIQLSTGQLDPAVDLWQRWSSDHPSDPQAPSTLGMLYESAGDEKAAAEYYRKSLAIESDQPNISARLAALMAASGGNVDVALSMAQAAYRARPASADTADALGWIYLRKGLPASALGPLQAAANADGTDATIQYHLGVVQARLGNKPDATSHLMRAQSMAVGTDIAAQAQQELAKLR